MRSVRRIVKIHKIIGHRIYCLFNNGESRVIDFEKLFKKWNVNKRDREYKISSSLKEFQKVKLIEGTLSWENIKIKSQDDQGNPVVYYFDLDPIVLYENSDLDKSRNIKIGMLIKQSRKEQGLTQEQLASRSGTSKHYISRLENSKTGIELSTLMRIVEGGLGKRMQINIV